MCVHHTFMDTNRKMISTISFCSDEVSVYPLHNCKHIFNVIRVRASQLYVVQQYYLLVSSQFYTIFISIVILEYIQSNAFVWNTSVFLFCFGESATRENNKCLLKYTCHTAKHIALNIACNNYDDNLANNKINCKTTTKTKCQWEMMLMLMMIWATLSQL